ncbi:MAG: hypothetical protein COB66_07675 [Coxiella sp. (in: Bacteria)]|nr:MAG: hypothetical protein COB66_07675 [Coxiella sp. (in: g-proteobacteria)]
MKILVVDDSKTSLFITLSYLEKMGHAVISTEDPTQACRLFQNEHPELVILDVVMEKMSGYECAVALRSLESEKYWVPIIFLSGNVDDAAIAQGIQAGGDDYLTKPVSEITLKAKIMAMERIAKMQNELLKAKQKLTMLSNSDTLTSIANRHCFDRMVHSTIAICKRNELNMALLFIDLDNFKIVNDTLGHHIGDLLLVQVTQRMQATMREGDFIARLGGDEFAIIAANTDTKYAPGNIAERLIILLQQPFSIEGHEVNVSASIGIAYYPEASFNPITLVKNADIAMYRAKESGRNNFQYFTPALNNEFVNRAKKERALRRALKEDEFFIQYQPKMDLKTMAVSGFEALIRWDPPDLSITPPDSFIPLAEETGLIKPIGYWVIETACQQIAKWIEMGYADVNVAINLSPVQLQDEQLADNIEASLAKYNVPASNIELEITETAILINTDHITNMLNKLHNMGITISIDDFGTGYSSLAHIKKLPIDTIKIDRDFVMDIIEDDDDAAIVKSIIALSHSLGLNVVAEGIETKQQLQFLLEHGCQQGQGFYMHKPLGVDEVTSLLKKEAKQ